MERKDLRGQERWLRDGDTCFNPNSGEEMKASWDLVTTSLAYGGGGWGGLGRVSSKIETLSHKTKEELERWLSS